MSRPTITLYTTSWCPYCLRAKALLDGRGIAYDEVNVEDGAHLRQEMIDRSGRRSVPQVFIGDHHVGGADELAAIARSGELDRRLAGEAA